MKKQSFSRSIRCAAAVACLSAITIVLFPLYSVAQEITVLQTEDAAGVVEKTATGWQGGLRFDGTFSLNQNSGVPGTTDGVNVGLGYMFSGDVGYRSPSGAHEWANFLTMALGYTRSATLEKFTKSNDQIDFRTAYLYHIPRAPWFGPFAGARLTTPMLAGYEIRSDPQNVIRLEVGEDQTLDAAGQPINPDGTPLTADQYETYGSTERIDLTGAFAPLLLRQIVGLFAIPVDRPEFKLDTRLGVAAWETLTRRGWVVKDNADTPDYLELLRLQDSVQLGGEFSIIMNGMAKEILTWQVSALYMMPFYHDSETKLSGIDLLNQEYEAALGVNITNYIGIAYTFKALKQPLIVDDWQIQNNLLITVGFGLRRPSPPLVVEPVAEPAPVVEPVAEPVAEPAPVAEPVAEPAPVAPDAEVNPY